MVAVVAAVLQIVEILTAQPVNYPQNKAERIAKRLLDKGEFIQFNTSDVVVNELARRINRIVINAGEKKEN